MPARPHVSRSRTSAFTLIELLVVISIIALLISLLLPALQAAKRRVKILTCMTQLQQLGVGLHTYVADDPNYSYMPPYSFVGSRVWDTSAIGGTNPDGRVIWQQISGGNPLDVMFSPFSNSKEYLREDPNDEWTKYYLKTSISYEIGYNLYLTLTDDNHPSSPGGLGQDFTNSGNPDLTGDGRSNGPYRPGDSDAIVVGDSSWADTRQCNLSVWRVCGASHSPQVSNTPGTRFLEGDYLFGDGHVETRNSLKYSIRRADGNTGWY